MPAAPAQPKLNHFLLEPLHGLPLVACATVVWLAGAAYCHGYERLLSGGGGRNGSLIWSAIAVVPWFGLFEWAKRPQGSAAAGRPALLAAMVIGVALLSILIEYATVRAQHGVLANAGLLVMRRMPAIVATLMLIFLARRGEQSTPESDALASSELPALASSIDYVVAADNYIELHIGDRLTMRRMTMRQAEQALVGAGFVRVHRRYLVNRRRIAAVRGNGDKFIRLVGGAEIPVGQRFAANLRAEPATSPLGH